MCAHGSKCVADGLCVVYEPLGLQSETKNIQEELRLWNQTLRAYRAQQTGYTYLRLSGSQLDRFNRLREVFAARETLQVELHLDGTAEVLLETALNAAGRSVTGRDMQDGLDGEAGAAGPVLDLGQGDRAEPFDCADRTGRAGDDVGEGGVEVEPHLGVTAA